MVQARDDCCADRAHPRAGPRGRVSIPGDRVSDGQVLIVLDGSDLAARARSARARAASAGSSRAAAEAERQAAEAAPCVWRAPRTRASRTARQALGHARRSSTTPPPHCAWRSAGAPAAAARAEAAAAGVESAQAASDAAADRPSRLRASRRRSTAWSRRSWSSRATWRRRHAVDARGGRPASFRLAVRVDESRLAQCAPARHAVQVALDAVRWSPRSSAAP